MTAYMQLYPGDYLRDTQDLTTEQHGAYLLILMTMWSKGGRLANDPKKLARVARCTPSRWAKIADDVLAFFVVDGDEITHGRLAGELEIAREKSIKRAIVGAKGGRAKALKDKKAEVAIATDLPRHSPAPDKEPPISPKGDADLFGKPLEQPPPPDPVQVAFDQWNDTARRWRLPVAVSLTDARRRAIGKRLAEAGPEGWSQALKAVEKSSLCVGQAPPRPGSTDPWRADLDFVCQAKSFNRLREGFYGNGAVPNEPAAKPVDPLDSWRFRVRNFQTDPGSWKRLDWGAPPGREPRSDEYPCKAPAKVLGEFNIQPWGA